MAIKIATGRGNFTTFGGLVQFNAMLKHLRLRERLGKDLLPGDTSKKKSSSYKKIKALILGFIADADCMLFTTLS